MNARIAKKIIAESNNGHDLDGLEMAAFNEAEGFMKAVEKFKPVVEALEQSRNMYRRYDEEWNSMKRVDIFEEWRIQYEKVLESYRRDVLGETE